MSKAEASKVEERGSSPANWWKSLLVTPQHGNSEVVGNYREIALGCIVAYESAGEEVGTVY